MADWHLYMIRCKDGSLYTGVTIDVARRFGEHTDQGDKCAKYLKGKTPLELVYCKNVGNKQTAYSEEFRVKQLSKTKKEQMIAN